MTSVRHRSTQRKTYFGRNILLFTPNGQLLTLQLINFSDLHLEAVITMMTSASAMMRWSDCFSVLFNFTSCLCGLSNIIQIPASHSLAGASFISCVLRSVNLQLHSISYQLLLFLSFSFFFLMPFPGVGFLFLLMDTLDIW